MSTQKILKINPELFKFSKKSKNKEKTKKEKPIVDKNTTVKTNKLKKELLKKVKDYQKNQEIETEKREKILENTVNSGLSKDNNLFDDLDFEREFSKSLTFLHDLSKKNKEKKKKKTIKREPDVSLELPKNLYDSQPKYGCLKNGSKPTFRELNKTQKNGDKRIKISLENNSYDDFDKTNQIDKNVNTEIISPSYDYNYNETKDNLNEIDTISSNLQDTNNIELIPKKNIDTQIELDKDLDLELDKDLDLHLELDKRKENFNQKMNNVEINIDNSEDNNNFIKDINKSIVNDNIVLKEPQSENKSIEDDIPKITRTTKKYRYKLGKKKNKNYIGLLVKNRETQKKIKQEVSKLKTKPIQEIKNYLREKNLIKLGSQAPNDVLRKLYEDSMLSGDINNTNDSNLVFNYLN